MKKILIVDDNPQNLYMLEILLETNGFEVHQASNGVEALEIAHKTSPDMIISDILMPVMDGFSLCRSWKGDPLINKIPFIFYTATYIDPKDEVFALSLGAERFIAKPMVPEDFLGIILEVFQSGESRGQILLQEPTIKEEEYFIEYNEALIRKLEDKMVELERANKRLVSLYQASCDLASMKGSGGLIQSVLRAIADTAGYPQVIYYLFDKDQNKLTLLSSEGFSEETLARIREKYGLFFGESRGLVGLAAQSGKNINICDTSKDARWISLDPAIKSALFVPVIYENNIMGVLALCSREINAFSEEDERNITALANSLAVSIQNEKTHEEILQMNTQLEQRVNERTAQLQNSNKELEAFSYSVSHDLRAPLRAIDGFAHILSEDYADKLDTEGNRLLKIICTNTAKMDKLITDLLALSRVNSSELELTQIDMFAMVNSVFNEIASAEERERITFEVTPLEAVNGDPRLIRQVWNNLISNAIKYSLPKEDRIIQIKSSIEGDLTIYSIQDNGVGFNPEFSYKLFGLFQRLHSPHQFEGTGIGLAIVKRIIERHGGQVKAEGAIDQGAKFLFLFQTNLDPSKKYLSLIDGIFRETNPFR